MNPALLAIVLMLISAVSHALAGVILKRSDDKFMLRGLLGATSFVIALPIALTLPLPPPNVWVFILIGIALHYIYQFAQAAAFTQGDMSIVYPVMRGVAPALTAVIAFLFLKESLRPLEIIGLSISVAALIGFGWPQKTKLSGQRSALAFAFFCGGVTAIYTVVDAYGIRLAPHRIAFIAWFFVIEGLGIALIIAYIKRQNLKVRITRDLRGGIMTGGLAVMSYSTALYAFSLAPIAKLAALRETSIIFAALFAALWLREDFGKRRIIQAIILAFGLILMQMA